MALDSAGDSYAVTEEFVVAMMQAFKEGGKIHRRFVYEILLQFQNLVKQLPSLVDVPVGQDEKITVCGDTHGQYFDLLHIFSLNGNPSVSNPYLFNGDFVDRGSWSVEVILTLMAWKVLEPQCMHLTRGNHEAKSLNKIYGFEGEVKAKYNLKIMDVFRCAFSMRDIAAVRCACGQWFCCGACSGGKCMKLAALCVTDQAHVDSFERQTTEALEFVQGDFLLAAASVLSAAEGTSTAWRAVQF
jgi:Calcineurin-like phosphoesterase/PPP5 TPR repeat region